MAWSGQLSPGQVGPDGRPTKRSQTAADLIDAWNASFLRPRGIEGVLYKGRERRSGRYAGTVDMNLPALDPADVSSPSASEDESEEDALERRERERDRERYGSLYADQRRRERRAERDARKQRKMDKKVKRRLKEADRTYALYLQCVPPTDERVM